MSQALDAATQEKMDRIELFWSESKDHHALMFMWVKTGHLSLGEYKQAMFLIERLES